jgi:excinuclease UvrABC nuclease subunit
MPTIKEIHFSSQQIRLMRGPGVYVYKSANGVPLYVGASAYGLGRAFGPSHPMREYQEDVNMSFIPCATKDDAFKLEVSLIREHIPRYNSRQSGGQGEPFPGHPEESGFPSARTIAEDVKRAPNGSLLALYARGVK